MKGRFGQANFGLAMSALLAYVAELAAREAARLDQSSAIASRCWTSGTCRSSRCARETLRSAMDLFGPCLGNKVQTLLSSPTPGM